MNNQEIIIIIPNADQSGTSSSLSSSSSCILCGSQDSCYQLTTDIRVKWSTNLCTLYNIDLVEAKTVIANACYCLECHQELRTISEIYTDIERLNQKLDIVRMKYDAQLRDLVECLANSVEEGTRERKFVDVKPSVKCDIDSNSNFDEFSNTCPTSDAEGDVSGVSEHIDLDTSCVHDDGESSIHSTETISKTKTNILSDSTESKEINSDVASSAVLLVWDDYAICYSQEAGSVQITNHDRINVEVANREESYDILKRKYKLKDCSTKIERMSLKDIRRHTGKLNLKKRPSRRTRTIRYVNESNSIPCSHEGCNKRFKLQLLADAHFKSKHQGMEKPFTCDKCNKTFRRHHLLREHHNIHDGLTPFRCPHCEEKVATSELLHNHLRKYHKSVPARILCESCGKSFPRHREEKHVCRSVPDGTKKFSCDICCKAFARRANLKDHRATHPELKLKQYKCSFCGKVLTSRKNFKAHVSKHTGEFKYKCELCNYGSDLVSTMKAHAIVHSDVKNHECEICQQKFKSAAQLRSHCSFKHSDGKNATYCHICGVKSSTKYTLERHVKTVHSDPQVKPFKCVLCSESFTIQEYLTKHMKRSHAEGKPLRGKTKRARKAAQLKKEDLKFPL